MSAPANKVDYGPIDPLRALTAIANYHEGTAPKRHPEMLREVREILERLAEAARVVVLNVQTTPPEAAYHEVSRREMDVLIAALAQVLPEIRHG
jgi:hypothetical protein